MFPGIIIVACLTFLVEDSVTRIPLYPWHMHACAHVHTSPHTHTLREKDRDRDRQAGRQRGNINISELGSPPGCINTSICPGNEILGTGKP